MDEGAPFTDQVSSGRRRTVVIIVVAIVILAAIALVVILLRGPDPRIAAELEELRAMGRPVSIADFGQPPIPDEDNAALVYREAFTSFVELSPEDADTLNAFVDHWETVDENALQVLRALVEQNKEALALIEKASPMPSCYFDTRWQDGICVLLPHLGEMRKASRMVIARARLRAMDGDLDGAVADTRTGLRCGGALHGQPLLISALVALVIESLSVEAIQNLCDHRELNLDMLRVLADDLRFAREKTDAAYILGTERVLLLDTIRKIRSGELTLSGLQGASGAKVQVLEMLTRWRIDFDKEELSCIRYLRRVEDLMDRPFYEIADRLEELGDEQQKEIVAEKLIVMSLLSPAFGRFAQEVAARAVRIDITRMGLAALAWRQEHGEWPEDPPLDFVDPFDGKPLRYRVENGVLLIWSIGRDRVDDGGTEWDRTAQKGDIVWELRPNESGSGESD